MKSVSLMFCFFLFLVTVSPALSAESQPPPDNTLVGGTGDRKESDTKSAKSRRLASGYTPCCEIIEIKERGLVSVREYDSGRIFNVQLEDSVQWEHVRVGQRLLVDFQTGDVKLYGLDAGQLRLTSRAQEYAPAEPFVDVYGGGSWTQKADVHIGPLIANNVAFNSSFDGGIRVGTWLPAVPYLGFAVDGFHFTTNIKPQIVPACIGGACGVAFTNVGINQDHFAVAFDVMIRVPVFPSDAFPMGRFQPYITVGPALFISSLEVPGLQTSHTTTVGFKGGAGGKLFFTEHLALFSEYRMTYFEPDQTIAGLNASTHLLTHHLVGGVSFHFN